MTAGAFIPFICSDVLDTQRNIWHTGGLRLCENYFEVYCLLGKGARWERMPFLLSAAVPPPRLSTHRTKGLPSSESRGCARAKLPMNSQTGSVSFADYCRNLWNLIWSAWYPSILITTTPSLLLFFLPYLFLFSLFQTHTLAQLFCVFSIRREINTVAGARVVMVCQAQASVG